MTVGSVPLRARVAQFLVVAILLIPVAMSSLRGLTHLLVCTEDVATPFTVDMRPDAPPVIATSQRFSPDDARGVCGGLELDLRARRADDDAVEMLVYIHNPTTSLWSGTVQLLLEQPSGQSLHLPVDVGRIPAEETGSAAVPIRLREGTTSLSGSLLIGP